MKCSQCDIELNKGLNYCPHCGKKLKVVRCGKCGDILEPNWRFCPNCATKTDTKAGIKAEPRTAVKATAESAKKTVNGRVETNFLNLNIPDKFKDLLPKNCINCSYRNNDWCSWHCCTITDTLGIGCNHKIDRMKK